MNLSKLTYSKEDSTRTPADVPKKQDYSNQPGAWLHMGQSFESALPIKAVLVLFCKSFKENLVTFDKMAKGCDGKDDSDCIVP